MASPISGLKRRLAREESGFTLIELLVVLLIIGILLAVAVPSYLGFKDRANRGAAQANVRSAVPAVEAYYADRGNYNASRYCTDRATEYARIALELLLGSNDAPVPAETPAYGCELPSAPSTKTATSMLEGSFP